MFVKLYEISAGTEAGNELQSHLAALRYHLSATPGIETVQCFDGGSESRILFLEVWRSRDLQEVSKGNFPSELISKIAAIARIKELAVA